MEDKDWDTLVERLAAGVRGVVREELERHSQQQTGPALLDVEGVASRLSISTRTVERLIADGDLVPILFGRLRRFSPESVDELIRRHIVRAKGHRMRKP